MDRTREPWWYQNKRQPRHYSLELIVRKSFSQILKEYAENCSLGGVKQMCEPGISLFQRFIWIAIFATAIGTSGYFLVNIWTDTFSKPLIVTMETPTYPIANVDFPAVAICNANRISKKALVEFAKEIYPKVAKRNESLELVEWFILQWGSLIDFSYNESLENHRVYRAIVDLYRFDTQQVVEIMKRLSPSCNEMLVRCSWAGKLADCKTIFNMRRTGRGHCCTFNFVLNHDTSGRPSRLTGDIRRQKEPGYLYGLNVILDPKLEDYAYTLGTVQGFDVFVFSPTIFPDPRAGRVTHRIVEPNKGVFFELSSIKQVATREVHKYSPETRNCYFQDEKEEEFNNMYTSSSCILSCRVRAIYSLCKCTPYFMAQFRTIADGPVCTVEDLKCLNKYKEKLYYLYPHGASSMQGLELEVQESLSCPECLPDCELTRHFTQSYEALLYTYDYPEKDITYAFRGKLNMTNMAYMFVHFAVPDSTLQRLDIVNYWFEILSNIGGFSGIILGFSVISVVEIIYYFFIRFFQILYANCQKYRK